MILWNKNFLNKQNFAKINFEVKSVFYDIALKFVYVSKPNIFKFELKVWIPCWFLHLTILTKSLKNSVKLQYLEIYQINFHK
jgi:hypothetical protein